jgi:hypothetical protein
MFVHPVWFHELLSSHRAGFTERTRQAIAASFRFSKFPVPARYLDPDYVDRSIVLWSKYCLSHLKYRSQEPPCMLKRICSAHDGRPLDGWALSKEMQKVALMDELLKERTRILVSNP